MVRVELAVAENGGSKKICNSFAATDGLIAGFEGEPGLQMGGPVGRIFNDWGPRSECTWIGVRRNHVPQSDSNSPLPKDEKSQVCVPDSQLASECVVSYTVGCP